MGESRTRLLVLDANVLIDLCDADRRVVRLISEHVGLVHVPLPILEEEVDQIDPAEYEELGIVPVEPSLEIANRAAARRAGLSFHDHLCLLLALEGSWTCVTNDGRLRRECVSEKVPVLWGLETVALVVQRGALSATRAGEVGRAIRRANPRYITQDILDAFLARIGGVRP